MIEKFKKLSNNEKGMIILIIILFFGILLRWGYVKQNAQRGINKYIKTETTTNR